MILDVAIYIGLITIVSANIISNLVIYTRLAEDKEQIRQYEKEIIDLRKTVAGWKKACDNLMEEKNEETLQE